MAHTASWRCGPLPAAPTSCGYTVPTWAFPFWETPSTEAKHPKSTLRQWGSKRRRYAPGRWNLPIRSPENFCASPPKEAYNSMAAAFTQSSRQLYFPKKHRSRELCFDIKRIMAFQQRGFLLYYLWELFVGYPQKRTMIVDRISYRSAMKTDRLVIFTKRNKRVYCILC